MGLFDKFKKTTKDSLLKYLQNRISNKLSLADIVNVFEEMCSIPIEEDLILFETGTYSFTGESMFNFSLVRQFPNDDGEYYQIHVDVLYLPEKGNKDFQQTTWNEDIEENNTFATGKNNVSEIAKTFCEALKAAGYKVGIYSTLYAFNSFFTDEVKNKYDRWLANVGNGGAPLAQTSGTG